MAIVVNKKIKLFLPLIIFILLAVFPAVKLISQRQGLAPSFTNSPLIGKPTPEFFLPLTVNKDKLSNNQGYETDSFTYRELKGHYSLINIFASWCVSCLAEHPILTELSEKNIIPIYGIAWKDKKEDLLNWLSRHGNPYNKIGADYEGKVVISFGITGAPETFLIDKDGIVILRIAGPLTQEIVKNEILPRIK